MGLIGLKYCGGCNPVIDRGALVKKIERLLPTGWELVTARPADPWGMAILVCGCPVACANRPDIKGLARHWVVISGPMIDLQRVSEEVMAPVIVKELLMFS